MATLKPRPTMADKVARVIKEAETVYIDHLCGEVVRPTEAVLDAAVFGYLYGISFNENQEIREVALNALQERFGWDDEYIATQIIGG